jgi:hypothetical protein
VVSKPTGSTLTLYGNVDIRTVNMSFRVGGRLASLRWMKAMR